MKYCSDLFNYQRRKSLEVNIGDVPLGGLNPIRVQSMTTTDTLDTVGTVEQSIRMIEAGCEYVRITAPSLKEAKNLEVIKKELRNRGYHAPLIADIHFTPNAAELAAKLVEKVRVNPGNYADKKKFETIKYTKETYQAEIDRIRKRFLPLVKICKEYGTAMRIGTNHGSLSDRILSRYGDTPLGMVESALEFLRICEDENYYNIVLSMKASNPKVMVQAYRLLCQKLDEEGLKPYPLHLGVTEAGDGDDGRIKSAMGIGALLEDGLGDTIRVSLTEEPEYEIPVASALANRYNNRSGHAPVQPVEPFGIDPFNYQKRVTYEVFNIGALNPARVIADYSLVPNIDKKDLKAIGHNYLPALDKWGLSDYGSDLIYAGQQPIPFMVANGARQIVNASKLYAATEKQDLFPLFDTKTFLTQNNSLHPEANFLLLLAKELNQEIIEKIKAAHNNICLVIKSDNPHQMADIRAAIAQLINSGVNAPVVAYSDAKDLTPEETLLYPPTDFGGLLVDGLIQGLWLANTQPNLPKPERLKTLDKLNKIAFGVLQASRDRMSKTEYISCPSCGRTQFDLQETTAMIRKRTDHLKGVKIGIMGCIVNGPGEMADADYGYVGVGKGKIALYRSKTVVIKSIEAAQAVDKLIELIRQDGKWVEPTNETADV